MKTGVCSEMDREIGHSVSRTRLQRALIRTMVFVCLFGSGKLYVILEQCGAVRFYFCVCYCSSKEDMVEGAESCTGIQVRRLLR